MKERLDEILFSPAMDHFRVGAMTMLTFIAIFGFLCIGPEMVVSLWPTTRGWRSRLGLLIIGAWLLASGSLMSALLWVLS